MTYFQIEAIEGADKDAAVATMVGAGYTPDTTSTIRLDQQDRNGVGWEAVKVTGLGKAPVAITATPSQVGETPRFVRKLPRNIDIKLNLKATDKTDRDQRLSKLFGILEDELLLRWCEPDGNVDSALPATYKYLRVYHAGGGTYSLGEKDGATDTELEMVITLRAHKPSWLTGPA